MFNDLIYSINEMYISDMKKYNPLRDYLAILKANVITLSMEDIGQLVDLPPVALSTRQWWANQKSGSRPQRDSWRNAGFKVAAVDLGVSVTFERCRW